MKVFIPNLSIDGDIKDPVIESDRITSNIVKFNGRLSHRQLREALFTFSNVPGQWCLTQQPLIYSTDEITVVSNYGPVSPQPEGVVEFRRVQ